MIIADLAGLHAAILANPDDDTVRLVYADCLQEHGEAGRAEFIRVQIELARCDPKPRELFVADGAGTRLEGLGVALIRRGDGYYSASTLEEGLSTETFTPNERVDIYAELAGRKRGAPRRGWLRGLKYVKHVPERYEIIFRKDEQSRPWEGESLRKREYELWQRNLPTQADWDLPTPTDRAWQVTPNRDSRANPPVAYLVRGFVSEIVCTLADWLSHGPAVMRAHPVRRVTLSDREPADRMVINERWYWFRREPHDPAPLPDATARLPSSLFDLLPGSRPDIIALPYATRKLALDALSDVCLLWARGRVS